MKLKQKKPKRRITSRNIMAFMRRYNSISNQIANHNNHFWSTYLFCVLLIYIAIIGFLLYQSLFGSAPIIIQFIFSYICVVNLIVLIFYNLSASVIVSSQKVSYRLFNMCAIKLKTRNINIKFKVILFY